jgi:hypothetical protein
MTYKITVVTYNGLCNRLLPLISVIRLAEKANKKIQVIWTNTPCRTNLTYYGEDCKFEDLFLKPEIITTILPYDPESIENKEIYEFEYWKNIKYIINPYLDKDIFVNYAVSTIISTEDNENSIFKSLLERISISGEIIFDEIGIELSNIIKKIKPVNELQNEIDKYKCQFTKNVIGVHIRISDGGYTEIDYIKLLNNIIEQLKKWVYLDIENSIFLTTDDNKIYNIFNTEFDNKLLFYKPPEILCGKKSLAKFNNDIYNTLCGVIDLHLLGNCNTAIIGTCGSSFSICGMLLSDINTKKYLITDKQDIPIFNF